MFDIGSFELLVIAVVALVVIGPKELPATLRTVAFWVRKARSMAREFQAGFEELTREAELDELRREVNAAIEKDPVEAVTHDVRETVENTIGPEVYSELDSAYPGSPVEEPVEEPAEPAEPAGAAEPEPAAEPTTTSELPPTPAAPPSVQDNAERPEPASAAPPPSHKDAAEG